MSGFFLFNESILLTQFDEIVINIILIYIKNFEYEISKKFKI